MKKLLALLVALLTLFAFACDMPAGQPGNSTQSSSQKPSIGEGYDVISVAEALALCGDVGNITT